MMKKIPFQNRVIALALSIIFALGMFLSLFALPAEFTFFNAYSYDEIFTREEYAEVLPKVLAETLVYQTSLSSQSNEINLVTNKDTIVAILTRYLPDELVSDSYLKATEQILAYLNFKIPLSDMQIDSTEIKGALISNSGKIAADYLAATPNCLASEIEDLDFDTDITASDLPECKPAGNDLEDFQTIWTASFEDAFNSLPSTISVLRIFPLQDRLSDQTFYTYSLVRWGIRLLPIVTILILILIAVLLRNQRDVMLKWCGGLILIISAITLLGLIILLIGFDQFVAMTLNPVLKNFISGFGYVVLGAAQHLGFQTLVWVLISTLVLMVFGFFLLLAGKFSKPKPDQVVVEEEESSEEPDWVDVSEVEQAPEKTIAPETIEEIEEEEKELEENNKKDEG